MSYSVCSPRFDGFNRLVPRIQGNRTSDLGTSVNTLTFVLLKLLYFLNQIADVSIHNIAAALLSKTYITELWTI